MVFNNNHIVVSISMIFWGIILIILLSMAQPLPPITQGVYIICMGITVLFILSNRKAMGSLLGDLGSIVMVIFGPWSLLVILSTGLAGGYYRKKPGDRISGSNPDL